MSSNCINLPEKWKPVVGFEGLYEVSDRGRVKSLKQTPAIIMKAKMNCHYREIKLRKNNKSFMRYIHRLVLEAHTGNCPVRMECRHLDGDKNNNNLKNLSWGTKLQNVRDSIRHGTQAKGINHPNAKLTMEDVNYIRSSQKTLNQLATKLGVSERVVYRVRAGFGYV